MQYWDRVSNSMVPEIGNFINDVFAHSDPCRMSSKQDKNVLFNTSFRMCSQGKVLNNIASGRGHGMFSAMSPLSLFSFYV